MKLFPGIKPDGDTAQAEYDASGNITEERGPLLLLHKVEAFPAEGGERGKATAEPGSEQEVH